MPLLAKTTDLDSTVEILKFLSDKNRLQLLIALCRAETCVCDLYDEFDLAQNLVLVSPRETEKGRTCAQSA